METVIIPIDGKDTKISLRQIEIDKLCLDELNPRISFFRDNQVIDNLTEEQIIFALTNKKPEAFRKLKDSIQTNRGILNPIWVESDKKTDKYKVIEGNTRLVIYRDLHNLEPNEERWKKIYCFLLPHGIMGEQKNFIRLQAHLRGATEWDAYEKAKYLYKLWDEDGWSITRLEKQTKLAEREIKANIEAYQLMDEQYLPKHADDPNEVSKFSYFVEYIKDKELQKLMKKNSLTINDFCEWVANKEKIPTGQDVRRLRHILAQDEPRKAFLTDGFTKAMAILEFKMPHLVSGLYKDIESVIDGLKNISAQEIDNIVDQKNGEKEEMIKNLSRWSSKVIKLIEQAKSGIR